MNRHLIKVALALGLLATAATASAQDSAAQWAGKQQAALAAINDAALAGLLNRARPPWTPCSQKSKPATPPIRLPSTRIAAL
jgi:hypothetical protein